MYSEQTLSKTIDSTAPTTRTAEFWAGIRATIPLIVGAIPFGIIFGAVAVTSGLSPAGTSAMSAIVFAGSAQFIAAGLVASGTSVGIIVLATLIVNLRHALYSVSLAPHMKHLPQRWLIPLGFWLTDETYVVAIDRYNQLGDPRYRHWFYFSSALWMYVNWQICTLIGIRAGQAIPNPEQWGLDFALIVTFIGMLMPLLKSRPVVLCVLVSGIGALLFHDLPNQLGLMVAVLAGIAAGIAAERFSNEPESRETKKL